jgi:hypothetical protein
MKKIIRSTAFASLALLATPLARAWTYTDGDALLIFRESGFNDVEFDIGNVSQFTSLAAGTTITVPNWNPGLVTNVFGTDLTGVSVIVAATTAKTDPNRASWLTGADASGAVHDLVPSAWQSKLWSNINGAGTKPVLNELTPTLTNAYSIDPGGVTGTAAYDYIVTGGFANLAAIAQFGANLDFAVEGVAPSSFAFWKISANLAKPPSQYVGTFTIDAGGTLTFTAGPLVVATPPTVLSITRAGGASTVNFTTAPGGNYWLTFTSAPDNGGTSWTTVSGPVAGDGNPHSLNHTNPGNSGYYRVVRTP